MKKNILFSALLLAMTFQASAQDGKHENDRNDLINSVNTKVENYAKDDTTNKTWKIGGLFNLNGSQTSLSNWAAGGDNFAMSINAVANGYAYYRKGKVSWDNNLLFNLGMIKTTSLGTRKNTDLLDLTSKYGYAVGPKTDVAVLFDLRTQMLKGYDYATTPKTKISNFFAPAYITLSPGINFRPVEGLSILVSPATFRWSVVADNQLKMQGLYGVDTGQTVKMQFGAYVSALYTHNITKTLSYSGRLDLFSNYLDKPQNIYLFMNNMFALKISSVLSATWNYNLIYDDHARLFGPSGKGARLQRQSIVGAGLLYKFHN